jgi:nondiscriminating aspartyl-tRNA synthetase
VSKLSNLVEENDLGEWRRTHYSSEITSSLENVDVLIMGWVSSVRDHGNMQFVILTDRSGSSQIVAKKGECSEHLYGQLQHLKQHSSIAIRGVVKPQKKAPNGAEIMPSGLKVFSMAKKPAPFEMQGSTNVGIDTRLDLRALDLRRDHLQNIFQIRHTILQGIREFLVKQNFTEVDTPKMIATSTEGGAALFPIFFYDREAFLAQSPQLYKEQLTMAFENVFEIGPIFRAEPSRTNKHLSEAISIDVEKAFVDYNDMMSLLEEMIGYIITLIKKKNRDALEYLEFPLPSISSFQKYPYTEVVEILQEKGERIKWGEDLTSLALKNLQPEKSSSFYFITDWPSSIKPFYVRNSIKSENICESFDLMYGTLELSSGSTRINRKHELLERMKKQGLNISSFDYHLRVFDYGVPPHAGFGIGLERLLMAITKTDNIRDATLYPRDIDRLTP